MATIRPSSDLRNHYNEISDYCNKYNRPVFITKNGSGDLVVMSNAEYERLCCRQELVRMLNDGIDDADKGRTRPASDVFADIERKLSGE